MTEIKNVNIHGFINTDESTLNTFRTLLLFGKNSATYKFAFCDALLKQHAKSHISYQDLLSDFVLALYQHYKVTPNQFQKGTNKLTQCMDEYQVSGEASSNWERLLKTAEGIIFNHVFDAFQNVGGGTIDKKFQLFEHHKKDKKLILTDNTLQVLESSKLIETIIRENQSRWGIVESAWRGGLSPNLMEFNKESNEFISVKDNNRVNLRSAVPVLSPYQKSKCFYCNREVDETLGSEEDAFPDVDHFFAFSSLKEGRITGLIKDNQINPNGVWNLVIACKSCNRGAGGKFDQKADNVYFDKLLKRNLHFMEEHKHSLKNGTCTSLNINNAGELKSKMNDIFKFLEIRSGWKPKCIF
jgi:hypothetical protein